MGVILLAGLGFGDEGKGSIVDYLTHTHTAHTVVRYNGGAQAGHNVVLPDGRHHTFSQFGSGTFSGAATYLSRFMMVNPLTLLSEAEGLKKLGISDPFQNLTVDMDAPITNVYQVSMNRILEEHRGKSRHGSCGMGIGETVADSIEHPQRVIRMRDLQNRYTLRQKLMLSQEAKKLKAQELGVSSQLMDSASWDCIWDNNVDLYADRYVAIGKMIRMVGSDYLRTILKSGTTIFEGAQGVLLDQDYGFHPHTTWSPTTFRNADELLLDAGYTGKVTRMGILRAYHTRHGAGPFPTETTSVTAKADHHNKLNPYQEGFRLGCFDAVLANYAWRTIGVLDEIAVTCLDNLPPQPEIAVGYLDRDKISTPRLDYCQMVSRRSSAIDRINPQPYPQMAEGLRLEIQEELTQLLNRITPVKISTTAAELVRNGIQVACPPRISICSVGPTRNDKQSLADYLRST